MGPRSTGSGIIWVSIGEAFSSGPLSTPRDGGVTAIGMLPLPIRTTQNDGQRIEAIWNVDGVTGTRNLGDEPIWNEKVGGIDRKTRSNERQREAWAARAPVACVR